MMPRLDPTARRPALTRWAAAVAILCLLAVATNCHDPQAPAPGPAPGDTDWSGLFSPGAQTLEFRLEGASGQISSLRLVASDLIFDTSTQQLHARVAIRNSGSEPLLGPEGVLVGGFDPSGVQPANAASLPCPDCFPCPCPFQWMFDHHGTYGEDGSLSPGETSTPVEWILDDPTGESFSFRARVQLGTSAAAGTIAGSVFADANANGSRDPGEIGISGAVVSLTFGDNSQVTQTDEHGRYSFGVSEAGLYEVGREPAGDCQPTTPLRRQVFIVQRPDGTLSGFDRADFGCGGNAPPDSGLVFVGAVYEDLNRDGVRQRGEPGVPGIGVTGSSGCPTFAEIRTYTDEVGGYRLVVPRCAPPYVVGHDPVPGFIDTSPNPIVFGSPGVSPPDSVPGWPPRDPPLPPGRLLVAHFGIARGDTPPDSISVEGFVFRDENHNGQMEPGEPGLAGIRVTASSMLCMIPIVAEAITDDSGHYLLAQADVHCPLPWMVGHDPVPGSCDTSPNPVILGGMPGDPTDPPIGSTYRVDFGAAACDTVPPPAGYAIEGVVFLDLDADGGRDPGEMGVPGAQVSLESVCALWRATVTDPRGHYFFAPETVAQCPVAAVRLVQPVFPVHTTPNPFVVDPGQVPPGGTLVASFGVGFQAPPR